jgi:flagellar motor switch protein FliN
MNAQENLDIKNLIIKIIPQIFNTMLSMEVEYSDSVSAPHSDADCMAGTLEFAGDVTGHLRILVATDFARLMMTARHGTETENIEGGEAIQNVLLEIINMTADHLKAVMIEAGFSCEHSAPSVSGMTDASADNKNPENLQRFAFQHAEESIIVEMGLNISEPSQAVAAAESDAQREMKDTPMNPDKIKAREDFDLDLLFDIPIELTVELGRTKIQIQELLKLGPGSAVSLSKLEGEPVDILANDTLIARGQVVVQDEKYGIRVTEITSRMDRIKSLS